MLESLHDIARHSVLLAQHTKGKTTYRRDERSKHEKGLEYGRDTGRSISISMKFVRLRITRAAIQHTRL